ncbi:MAG: insulinase family protein [Lachnospiraceae bacterium]|nr:insulinase family protein [Lachnospiraceae bacterium]
MTKNGIPVYTYPNRHLHSFCIALYVKAGCLYEREEDNGITHLLEHLVFRNIDKKMNGQMYRILDRCGLSFNASTYKEFVQFLITGAPAYFDQAVDIMSHIFDPLTLSASQIEVEKQRVKAEIREKEYEKSLDCFTDQIIWKGTCLTRDIAGKIKYLNKMGQRKLADAHRDLFYKDNIFFYLTGDVEEGQIDSLSEVLEQIYWLPEEGEKHENLAPVPEAFFHRTGEVQIKNSEYCYIRFSFDIDVGKYKNAELDLLYDILFSGDSCVVYQELSEKSGLIYSFDARFEQYRNIGNLHFSYEVRHNNLLESVAIITEKLHDLKGGLEERLPYVLPPYVDNAYIMYDDVDDFNWCFAYENHILECGYADIEERRQAYQKVSAERLNQVADEILRRENLTVTLKGQKKKINLAELEEIIKKL